MERPSGTERHGLLNGISLLLIVFLVLFPKGGIKIGETPITWGYVLVGLTAFPAIVVRLLTLRLAFRPSALLAFGTVIPFAILALYSARVNGVTSVGILLSDLSGFVIFPFLFLLIYPAFLPAIDAARFGRYFRFCVLAAALWGIFLFIWRPIFGFYIEIPLLTVNLADFGQLEATKHIDRGAFFKLISTYNNGNVYGVATLTLFPLYKLMERSRWKRAAVRFALVLTLSRTVWLGILIEELLSLAASFPTLLMSLPRIDSGQARRRAGALALTLVIVFVGFLFSVQSLAFLTDSSLGGRQGQFEVFAHPTFLPSLPLAGFAEVMYSSALLLFGITGLLAILLIFLSPLGLIALFPKLLQAPTHRAAAKGLFLYAIIAGADGATNLIPVMAFYWFTYMVFLHGLPGEQRGGVMERFNWSPSAPSQGRWDESVSRDGRQLACRRLTRSWHERSSSERT